LYVDTAVAKHEVFEQGEEVALTFYCGGGTDMEEGFNYIAKEGIKPEVFVCLTDGYTDFSEANAPDYPVVWCISSDIRAPYGDNIPFTLEQ
jgi:predicted metal-dependent peptidase